MKEIVFSLFAACLCLVGEAREQQPLHNVDACTGSVTGADIGVYPIYYSQPNYYGLGTDWPQQFICQPFDSTECEFCMEQQLFSWVNGAWQQGGVGQGWDYTNTVGVFCGNSVNKDWQLWWGVGGVPGTTMELRFYIYSGVCTNRGPQLSSGTYVFLLPVVH
jgi:hypothetical protein